MAPEAAVVFNQDVASRSKLAKMDLHRAHGKATSGLGKKPMTNAEIAEKHGPVHECDLNGFMTFSEFHNFSADTQKEWINKIQDKYDVGLLQISRVIFKLKDDKALRGYLVLQKILKDCNPDKRRRKTGLEQLKDDVRNWERGVIPFWHFAEEFPNPDDIPKFMSWEEFKELKNKEKVIFVNRLLDEYNIGMATVQEKLWHIQTVGKLRSELIKAGVYNQINTSMKSPSSQWKQYKEGRERFERDIAQWEQANVANEIEVMPVKPICDNVDIDFDLVDKIKAESVFTNPKGEFKAAPAYCCTEKEETVMPPKEAAMSKSVIQEVPEKQSYQKLEFSACYEANRIAIAQCEAINSMLEIIGKPALIKIEVRVLDD